MKRIIGLLFIVLSLSCCSKSETDKEGGGNYVLSLTPQNLKFPANGDSQNVIVASNGQWSLSGGDSWCTPTITSGGNGANVTFSVQKNIELQPRDTSFTFTLGDEKETLYVTQEAVSNSNISLNPKSATVSSNSNTQSVIVTCNGTWALSGETVSWCRPSKTSGENNDVVAFNIDKNNLSDDRNAAYTLTCATESAKFVLTQKGKDALTVTKSKFEVSAQGEQIAVEVNANISFEYEIAQADKSWVSYVGTRAMTTSRLLFSISPNKETATREGTITITSGIGKETIKIYQFGASPALVLTQKEYIVPSDGQTIKVELNSNVDYEVAMPSVDWITESPTRAISTHTHYYTIAENLYGEDRSSEIHFLSREHNIDEIVVIRQNARSFESMEPPYFAGQGLNYYQISNLNHLIWLSEQSSNNGFYEIKFRQSQDIDMCNYPFTPINDFNGDYNGNDFKLFNLHIDNSRGGLFKTIGDYGKVSNIHIASGTVESTWGGGGIACTNFGQIIDCSNNATIQARGPAGMSFGGLVGHNGGLILRCWNTGNVSGYTRVGGIAGENWGLQNPAISGIAQCYNTGKVEGIYRIGGITGLCEGEYWVIYCHNSGTIIGNKDSAGLVGNEGYIGGIVGEAKECMIDEVYNIGKIINNSSSYRGDICGATNSDTQIFEYRRLHYSLTDPAIGNNRYTQFNGFEPGLWPDWTIGGVWKSMGYWVGGGVPNGINSVFPKLSYEE